MSLPWHHLTYACNIPFTQQPTSIVQNVRYIPLLRKLTNGTKQTPFCLVYPQNNRTLQQKSKTLQLQCLYRSMESDPILHRSTKRCCNNDAERDYASMLLTIMINYNTTLTMHVHYNHITFISDLVRIVLASYTVSME